MAGHFVRKQTEYGTAEFITVQHHPLLVDMNYIHFAHGMFMASNQQQRSPGAQTKKAVWALTEMMEEYVLNIHLDSMKPHSHVSQPKQKV